MSGNYLGRDDISCGHQINPPSIDRTHVSFMSCSSSNYHLATACQVSGRERPLQCPSPAAMTLKRTVGPTPLPFNSSVYHFEVDIDDEKAQCRRQTSILYQIFDPYPFLYPILCLLAVRVPHKLSLRRMLAPIRSLHPQPDSLTLSTWPRISRYGVRAENLVSGIFRPSDGQRGNTRRTQEEGQGRFGGPTELVHALWE